MDYTQVCFVVMPFGLKNVDSRTVDFDRIYDNVFVPAIESTSLPEGGHLKARRTDRDFFSGDISQEMFDYLEYSRYVVADISGLNPNVMYELGVRHRARESGTAIFRQVSTPLPFDINHIKAFPYEYEPEESVQSSRTQIREVLEESLKVNRLDSPAGIALRAQQNEHREVSALLIEAENAIRNIDRAKAISLFRRAVVAVPSNPDLRMKIGLLLKDLDDWAGALDHFAAAISCASDFADAYREMGVAENKLFKKGCHLSDGEQSLRKAIELNPEDFDAHACLGGVLKRQGRYEGALFLYEQATELSRGNPYPLLNAIKIKARLEGSLAISGRQRFLMAQAERSLQAQVKNTPAAYNAPWSFFDLSEIRLYNGCSGEFMSLLKEGLIHCSASWQVQTHLDSLRLLSEGGVDLPGLSEAISAMETAIDYF